MTLWYQPDGGSGVEMQPERQGTGTPYPLWSRQLERLLRTWATRERWDTPKLPDESVPTQRWGLITSGPL